MYANFVTDNTVNDEEIYFRLLPHPTTHDRQMIITESIKDIFNSFYKQRHDLKDPRESVIQALFHSQLLHPLAEGERCGGGSILRP